MDRSVAHASPINAIVVLSRADEIGAAAGRPRLGGGRRAAPATRGCAIASRSVAGLIAETGATLRETQVGWLRQIAALPETSRDRLLLSVERFRDPDLNPLSEEIARSCWSGSACSGCGCRSGCLPMGPPGPRPTCPPLLEAFGHPGPEGAGRSLRHAGPGTQARSRGRLSASSRNRWTGAVSTARRTSSSRSTDWVVVEGAGAPAAPPRADRRRRAVAGRKRGPAVRRDVRRDASRPGAGRVPAAVRDVTRGHRTLARPRRQPVQRWRRGGGCRGRSVAHTRDLATAV